MSEAIVPDWPRPHHEPSPARAELLYLVLGDPPEHLNVKRARHHVDSLEPEHLVVSKHARADDPAWFDAWLTGPMSYGLDPVFDADRVRAAKRLSVVRGSFPDPPSLAYLRNTIGIVSAIAESGTDTLAIFDAYALTWWRPGEWRQRFVDASAFRITDHLFIAVTDDPRRRPGLWTHTRGMKKFARPELHAQHLPGPYDVANPAIRHSGDILTGLAHHLALGAQVVEGQVMHLPTWDARITFFEDADPQTLKYFSNAALEVCDVDPATGLSSPGIGRLLEAMRGRDE